jgi:hypothetical protein
MVIQNGVVMAKNVRYQIFVSSTYTDLFPVRRQVTDQILSMNHIPAGMEMFSASGREQWTTIQKAIDNSDYYVLIIGERYGSISPEDGISYTEKEFNYAVSKNIPTLCFLPGKDFSTSREHRDTDPALVEKLEAFKRKVKSQLCDFWENGNELVNKVSAALYKIFTEEPGTGWIRGNAADPDALTKLVHALEENKQLSKRIQQLEELNNNDIPALSLLINGHDFGLGPLRYTLPEPKEPVLFTPDVQRSHIPSYLTEFVNQADLEKYNSTKPTQDQVDKHNELMRFYLATITEKLEFTIKNDGPVKANNISIRIKFPEGIRVLDESKVENLKEPELDVPVNIIEIAESNYQSRYAISKTAQFDYLSLDKPLRFSSMNSALRALSSPANLTIKKDGSIAGSRPSVRQTTTENLTSYIYLAPETRGQFSISVEILCDEYREWQMSTLEIIIE